MVDRVMTLPGNPASFLLATVVRWAAKGEYRKELLGGRRPVSPGFASSAVDGEFYDIEKRRSSDKKVKHDIEVVVRPAGVCAKHEQRLADSFWKRPAGWLMGLGLC